jgi:hypothetical protein
MVESLELRAASVTVDDRHQDPIGGTARADSRPTKGGSVPVANLPFFKNMKITKRTQFKNRTIRHRRQLRRTT